MTKDDILDLLDEPIDSAAVGAALELGLFWLLAPGPLGVEEISARLGVPAVRCEAWLRVLERRALVTRSAEGYSPSDTTARAILGTYSRESWALLALEARERAAGLADLPARLRAASPEQGDSGESMAEYVEVMAADPARAARFTKMLYELHQELAAQVADTLDLRGRSRLLDLGGGSGVVAGRLAGRWPALSVTVVDVASVCRAARALVDASVARRVDFVPADFLHDDLPGDFDVVLECDVGIYSPTLFDRVRRCLKPGGIFAIVDDLPEAAEGGSARWALMHALADPNWSAPILPRVRSLLEEAGFGDVSWRPLTPGPGVGGPEATCLVLEAVRT